MQFKFPPKNFKIQLVAWTACLKSDNWSNSIVQALMSYLGQNPKEVNVTAVSHLVFNNVKELKNTSATKRYTSKPRRGVASCVVLRVNLATRPGASLTYQYYQIAHKQAAWSSDMLCPPPTLPHGAAVLCMAWIPLNYGDIRNLCQYKSDLAST